MSMIKWLQVSFWLGKYRLIRLVRTNQSFASKCKQILKNTTPLIKHQSIFLGLFKSVISAGFLACVTVTGVHAKNNCVPRLVTELFFYGGEVETGIYLDLQKIGELPKHVAENPRIRDFLSGYKNSTFVPLIVVGAKAPSSNYHLQMITQENGVPKILWMQRRFSDTGLMALGHPMWLGLWNSQCTEPIMTVN